MPGGGKCTMNRVHTKYHYNIETYPGYSGAAIFSNSIEEQKDSVVNIYGIHVYGDKATQDNVGIKLNTKKIEWINNCLKSAEEVVNNNAAIDIENKLAKMDLKRWWKCKNCTFINQRWMVGNIWHLLYEKNKCWLCGFCNEEEKKFDETKCIIITNNDIGKKDEQDEKQINNEAYPVYRYGIAFSFHELSPFHSRLKEEISENKTDFLVIERYDGELVKALHHVKSKTTKDHFGQANKTDERFGIEIDEPIHIENILSLLFYSGFTMLCNEFRKSCSAQSSSDTIENITERHVNSFYWMGRFVKCSIEFWGQQDDSKKKAKLFYMALSGEFIFDTFSAVYQTPTSTTANTMVLEFAESGMVLTVTPKYKATLHKIRYIDMRLFSPFGEHEEERLFAGDTVLSIVNIQLINTKTSLSNVIKTILYFARITEQSRGQLDHYNVGHTVSLSFQKKYLVHMLKYQMNKNGASYIFKYQIKKTPTW
eukprot:94195_1